MPEVQNPNRVRILGFQQLPIPRRSIAEHDVTRPGIAGLDLRHLRGEPLDKLSFAAFGHRAQVLGRQPLACGVIERDRAAHRFLVVLLPQRDQGAHLPLQTRTTVLAGDLEGVFRGWYPQFRSYPTPPRLVAALLLPHSRSRLHHSYAQGEQATGRFDLARSVRIYLPVSFLAQYVTEIDAHQVRYRPVNFGSRFSLKA